MYPDDINWTLLKLTRFYKVTSFPSNSLADCLKELQNGPQMLLSYEHVFILTPCLEPEVKQEKRH
jgi:hypothetical protein